MRYLVKHFFEKSCVFVTFLYALIIALFIRLKIVPQMFPNFLPTFYQLFTNKNPEEKAPFIRGFYTSTDDLACRWILLVSLHRVSAIARAFSHSYISSQGFCRSSLLSLSPSYQLLSIISSRSSPSLSVYLRTVT